MANKKVTKNTDEKKELKSIKRKRILNGIKDFFNRPTPLFCAFIIIIVFLLIYIGTNLNKDKLFVGEVDEKEVSVRNIHYFTNKQMNYFYADKAVYSGEEKTVYSYQIGYFVKNNSGDLIELATRSGSDTDSGYELSQLINDMSGWNFGERYDSPYYFSKDALPYIDKLYFVVYASTSKDSKDADIDLEYEVGITNLVGNK